MDSLDRHSGGRVCDPNRVQYSYTLNVDDNDPNNYMLKSITCTDDPMVGGKKGRVNLKAACRRDICECDKKLAEDLRDEYMNWDQSKHAKLGGFDQEGECKSECAGGNCGGNGGPTEKQCCGTIPNRFPYKMSDSRKCCEGKTYDANLYQCCQDGSVALTCA